MSFILTLKDNKKKQFFLQLMKQLDFIADIKEINLSANQLKLINDFEESTKYLEQSEQGKNEFKTAQQLIDEL